VNTSYYYYYYYYYYCIFTVYGSMFRPTFRL